jgi:hypothetical protein
MITSRHCKNLLKEKDVEKIKCIKSIKFNKWVPICQDISELDNVLF